MQIRCVSCRKDIPAEDVNLDNGLAKCRSCHAVFEFADQVRKSGGGGAAAAPRKRQREPVPMPKNLAVAEGPQTLDIVRRWGRGPGCFLLFFATFWNSIVSVFVVAAASGMMKEKGTGDPVGWFIWLFLTPFIIIGVATGYTALAFLLNSTTIKVEGNELKIGHGPLRWPGAKSVDPSQISQLYCSEYVAYTQNRVPQYRFKVHAIMMDGSRMDLVGGLDDAGQALYLEQILEKHLGIEDRPVKDEYQGGHLD